MRRLTGVLGATALVGALVAGSANAATTTSPADAANPDGATASRDWPPWIPYEQEDVTYAAGDYCAFEVFGEVLRDKEVFRNISTYADGSPRTQLWRGPLVMRFTNMETGFSVDRNASGRAFMEYGPGEAFQSLTVQAGHFVGGARQGSEPGQGIIYVGGKWSSLVRNDDGSSTFFLGPNGSAENLCDTLTR
jgi:hypothetical protein